MHCQGAQVSLISQHASAISNIKECSVDLGEPGGPQQAAVVLQGGHQKGEAVEAPPPAASAHSAASGLPAASASAPAAASARPAATATLVLACQGAAAAMGGPQAAAVAATQHLRALGASQQSACRHTFTLKLRFA